MKIFSNKKSQILSKSTRRGFTLIEMIVALGIFSIVAVVALGALIKIVSANKKAQTLQSSITNINFALDSISREMRVGMDYSCSSGTSFTSGSLLAPATCGEIISNSSGAVLAFTSSKSDLVVAHNCNLIYAYRFNPSGSNWSLEKAQQKDCSGGNFDGDWSPIIDPGVTITGYYIKVVSDAGHPYPMAVLRISGYAGTKEKEKTYFDVQTTISARIR